MKTKTRVLSLIMTMVMIISLLPTTALAAMLNGLSRETGALSGLPLAGDAERVTLSETIAYTLTGTWNEPDGAESVPPADTVELDLQLALESLTMPADIEDVVSVTAGDACADAQLVQNGDGALALVLTRPTAETEEPEESVPMTPIQPAQPVETPDETDPAEEETGDAERTTPVDGETSPAGEVTGGDAPAGNDPVEEEPADSVEEPIVLAETLVLNDDAPVSDVLCTITVDTSKLDAVRTEEAQTGTVTLRVGKLEAETTVTIPAAENGTEGKAVEWRKEPLTQTITWVDNHNEDEKRPSKEDFANNQFLCFTVDGVTKRLTEENMKELGLTEWPVPTVTGDDGVYTLTYPANTLPTKIEMAGENGEKIEKDVTWSLRQPEVEGYGMSEKDTGGHWHYMLERELTFNFLLNTGVNYKENSAALDKLIDHIQKKFKLHAKSEGSDKNEELPVPDWEEMGLSKKDFKIEKDEKGNKKLVLTVPNVWKYNVDGKKIEYYIQQNEPSGEIHGLPESVNVDKDNDYLTIEYDNTHVPNYSQHTEQTYSGGEIKLTLVGETKYSATKVWIDPPEQDRPDLLFQLWRYREGEDFRSADIVRKESDNTYYEFVLDEGTGTIRERGTSFDSTKNDSYALTHELLDALPKYDAEGYRYIYCLREYMEDPKGYTQVYGKVEGDIGSEYTVKDTVPYNESRKDGDRYIYDTGTITNHYNNSATVDAVKVWNASAYQAYLKDVKVELTLQSRIVEDEQGKPVGGAEWTPVENADGKTVTKVKNGFSEEELGGWYVSGGGPLYDAMGNKLKYRWVETGVFQGSSGKNLLKDGAFTLDHNGKNVTYTSTSVQDEKDGTFTITNAIADTIDYAVTKVWGDGTRERSLTFHLYRVPAGDTLGKDAESYLDFTMNGDDITITKAPSDEENIDIRIDVTGDWKVNITGLPQFDEEGRAYEYILVEDIKNVNDFHPEYDTDHMANGNYSTTVTNIVGQGQPVMVTKEWLDDGDIGHRGKVIVEVYQEDGTRLNLNGDDKIDEKDTVVLNEGNGWHQVITCPEGVDPEKLYIVETWVGDTKVNGNKDGGTYENNYHKYVVSYLGKNSVNGVWNYTVANRRVGEVNVSATKIWNDGGGKLRDALNKANAALTTAGRATIAPYLRLKFADSVEEHTLSGNTITWNDESTSKILDALGGEAVNPQKIFMGKNTDRSDYFWQAPKYDPQGAVVHYEVEEFWQIGDEEKSWEEVKTYLKTNLPADQELLALLADYTFSLSQTYKAYGELETKTDSGTESQSFLQMLFSIPTKLVNLFVGETDKGILPDEQEVTVKNSLSGSKTIYWHKEWKDEYAYKAGIRPDIYLDIFRTMRDASGNITGVERVMDDYRWNYMSQGKEEEELGLKGDPILHWHVVLTGMPKYDENGYEIFYYAEEHTKVDAAAIDYYPVKYSHVIAHAASPATDGSEAELHMEEIGTRRGLYPDYEGVMASTNGQPCVYALDKNAEDDQKLLLLEGGMFTNGLQDAVTIEGQKLWLSIPSGYPFEDLPGLKFTVSRTTNDPKSENAKWEQVATTTIEKWADPAKTGTFPFAVMYLGHNVMASNQKVDGKWDIEVYKEVTDEDGKTQLIPDGDPTPLEQYDENGARYTYELTEVEILYKNGGSGEIEDEHDLLGIFKVVQPDPQTYLAQNSYEGVKGHLAIKKILELQKDKDGNYVYPAVKFHLERFYKNNAGEVVKDEHFKVDDVVWNSSDGTREPIAANIRRVSGIITFDNLEVYAPNGENYLYKVTEIKNGFLEGYDTWVGVGNLNYAQVKQESNKGNAIGGDIDNEDKYNDLNAEPITPTNDGNKAPEIAATFLNLPQKTTFHLKGEKSWADYDDTFGLRPNEITLEIYRRADAQDGQNNSIGKQWVRTITVKPNVDGKWSLDETDIGNEFDQYAPNGRPWIYWAEESGNNGYYDGKFTANENGTVNLTNSIQTNVPFSKRWTDTNGKPIDHDYLGVDLSVTFKLQVREKTTSTAAIDSPEWQDAQTYFRDSLLKDNATFMASLADREISGRINAKVWSGSFTGLPRLVTKTEPQNPIEGVQPTVYYLEYRVVETQIACGGYTQTVKVDNDDKYTLEPANGLFTGAGFIHKVDGELKNITTNTLDTTALKVRKVWVGDNNNAYGTRPGLSGFDGTDNTWEVRFLVQRGVVNGNGNVATWSDVLNGGEGGTPVVIKLHGKNADKEPDSELTGLPIYGVVGGELVQYAYRGVELQPGDSMDIVADGGAYYDGAYKTTYDHVTDTDGVTTSTATNTLNIITPPDPGPENKRVGVIANKHWQPGGCAPEGASVTLELQYLDKNGNWVKLEAVTLNGESVENPSGLPKEITGWSVYWLDLPARHPNSKLETETSITQYRVVETAVKPDNYTLLTSNDYVLLIGEGGTYTFNFFNVPKTSLTVEKKWPGNDPANMPEVTVGLYRKLVTDATGDAVLDAVGKPITATLNNDNWTYTFQGDLPLCDEEGVYYTYYAKELTIGGKPIEGLKDQWFVYYEPIPADDGTFLTRIFNIPAMDLTGTKTWLDDHDSHGTRPNDLKLILERTLALGTQPTWETVPAAPDWVKNGDKWNYTYENLPTCTPEGVPYTYRVLEVEPGGDYVGMKSDFDFTNRLYKKIELTGVKTWHDNNDHFGKRPEDLKLTLYRTLGLGGKQPHWEEVPNVTPTWSKEGNTWTYTYSNLDKYDRYGAIYTYRVQETVPDGYDVMYKNVLNPGDDSAYGVRLDIINYQRGGLTISKQVTGNLGDTDKEFRFTLILSGSSHTGIAAEAINGTGYDVAGQIAFRDGVAEFTLKHGQSVTFQNLPAGLQYTVTETEADQDGYTTTIPAGASGVIRPGLIETDVTFVNRKHQPPKPEPTTEITGKKFWEDDHDAMDLRPNTLQVKLYRSVNGGAEELVNIAPTWSKNGDVWAYRFQNLPLRDSRGNRYTYRVEEVVPDGYTGKQNGNDFTNTLDQETVDIPVEKIWNDNDDAAGKRPDSITAILYANGVEVGRRPLTAAGEWRTVFRDLAKFGSDGALIHYTVREAIVPNGYTVDYDGWTIENTIIPPTWPTDPEEPETPEEPELPLDPAEPGDPKEPGDSGEQPKDPGKPDDTPQTGDPTQPWLWLGLCLASLLTAGVLALGGRRRGKREL